MNKCKTCPFILNTSNYGRADWLIDVFKLFYRGSVSHSCHVTDADADGYVGGQKRDCVGIKQLKSNVDAKHHIFKDVFKTFKDFYFHHLKEINKELSK